MRVNGNLNVIGLIKDLKVEQLATDPVEPAVGRIWYNSAENVFKYFNGTTSQPFAAGASVDAAVLLDGSKAMTGELQLDSTDQSLSTDLTAVSKGYLDTVAGTKQDSITGAATSIVADDLATQRLVLTDETGKIVASTTATAAEAEYLAGTTSNIQVQIDEKQASLGYEPVNKAGDGMTGELNMNNNRISGLASPVGDADAVRKADLESAIMGLDFQADVEDLQVDATTDPGLTPATGDRYILTDIAALHANFGTIEGVANDDIVEYDGTSFVTVWSLAEYGEGVLVWDRAGDTFQYHNGTVWNTFGGVIGITAGFGLVREENTLSVDKGAGLSQFPDSKLGVDVRAEAGLWLTEDGLTASTAPSAQLGLRLADASLATGINGAKVAASGVNETHINGSAVGNGLQGGDGAAVSVFTQAASGVTVDPVTGVSVDRAELRNTFLGRDGVEAMTDVLRLSSADQTGAVATAAVSKGHLDASVTTLTEATDAVRTRLEGGYFVYEGAVAAFSHTVVHDMGNKYVQVSAVDSTDEVVIPESITYLDDNSLTVTFSTEETCRIVVTGLKTVAVPEEPIV